jgi:hypothetical protein
MDPIQPIHGFAEEEMLIQPAAPVKPQTTDAVDAQKTMGSGTAVDALRMQKDDAYFVKTLKYMLSGARAFYNTGQYGPAEELYGKFFRYLHAYRADSYYSSPIDYYPAMFEYSWTMEIQGQKAEAQKFLNSELLRLLETITEPQKPELRPVQEALKALQNQGTLPAPGKLQGEVDLTKLPALAQQLAHANHGEKAVQLLGHLEVRYLLEASDAKRLAGQIAKQDDAARAAMTATVSTAAYTHLGLPVAPVMPVLREDAERIHRKSLTPEERIDRVNPISATSRYPQDQGGRGSRQRSPQPPAKKRKTVKTRQKPRITF